MNIKSDNFLIVLLSFFTLLTSGLLVYVLYTHYPHVPVFGARAEGYRVFLTADKFADKHMPLEVWRDGMLVKKITDIRNFSLEYLPPGKYAYTVSYTAQNMLGMDQRREEQVSFVVLPIPNKELAQYFDFPKVRFSNKGYAVYVSAPSDLNGYSQLDVFEGDKLLQSISKDTAASNIFLGYFSPGAHAFQVSFISDGAAMKSLHGIVRQDYEMEVGTIAAFREEGYKVLVTIQNLNGITSPVVISRDGKRVRSFQKEGEYVLEYVGPGQYTYSIGYTIRDASGEDKKLEITKNLSVSEYTREELAEYYDFPNIEFVVKNYGMYASASNTKAFSKITLYENRERIDTFTLNDSAQTFIGNLPLGTHTMEVAFVSEETRKIENLLRKEYEVEVMPIAPSIASLSLSRLVFDQTLYSSNATTTFSNAATCTAELLEQRIDDTSAEPRILKNYAFKIGEGFNYFSPRTESWSWKDISLSSDIEHKAATLQVHVKCYDYYHATSTELTKQIPTDDLIFPSALALTYAQNNTSSTTEGVVQNNANTAFNCELLVNDNASSIVLDKKIFQLPTQGTYTFNTDQYNKNQLSTTVTCVDSVGNRIVKTSLYNKQAQLSFLENKEQGKPLINKNLAAVYNVYKVLLQFFSGELFGFLP